MGQFPIYRHRWPNRPEYQWRLCVMKFTTRASRISQNVYRRPSYFARPTERMVELEVTYARSKCAARRIVGIRPPAGGYLLMHDDAPDGVIRVQILIFPEYCSI